ncbi:hypothetical protein QJS10_CPB15g00984 [Acorus calamus]|uniref:Serine-rich protein-like protein n=1 Tax=Acorus calamus TaxID=4465 RepID=A0AAV9D6L3_ACOCL|nr:hypothetical protein QJS10_CPB15g00984 [Acorus calamus]
MEEVTKTSPKNSLPGTPRKLSIPDSPLACDKRPPPLEIASPSSTNARPATLQKQMSVRNCLCSPTTHVGSFRCRYHRSSSLSRGNNGSIENLSELSEKSPSVVGGL